MTEITMPRLSDSMEEGTILTWIKNEGEQVSEGEDLVEIETDKATMTYPSPAAGVLRILAEAGTSLSVGAPIAHIGAQAEAQKAQLAEQQAPAPQRVQSEAQATQAAAAPAAQASVGVSAAAATGAGGELAPASAPTANGASGGQSVRATPIARRLALIHNVDLSGVAGTGPRGRITRRDVADAAGIEVPAPGVHPAVSRAATTISSRSTAAVKQSAGEGAPSTQESKPGRTVRELTRLQQVIVRRMSEAKSTVPEFQVQTEAQMDAAIALRAQLKETGSEIVPSINDFVVKASALALRSHPLANGSYRDGRFVLHEEVNVGIAVAAAEALVVPTIAHADTRSLGSIAAEARRLCERVREGTVTPPELSGATFTVSNLGMYGMTAINPVINVPQAAILGVGTIRQVLARDGQGEIVDRHLLTLTLTCDHRILYGADAALFLGEIKALLEAPLRFAF